MAKRATAEETPHTAEEFRSQILQPVREELERIRNAEKQARQEAKALSEAHAVKLAEWRKLAAEARQAYQLEPLPPEQPDIRQQHAMLHRMTNAREIAYGMERKALANSKWEAETAWGLALPALAQEAQEALQPLQALLGRVRDWRGLLQDSRRAYENQDGMRALNGSADRMISEVTLTDLLDLAEGVDLMVPEPLPPRPEASRPLAPGRLEEDRAMTRAQVQDRERRRLAGGRPGW